MRSPFGLIRYNADGNDSERGDAAFAVVDGCLFICDNGYEGDLPVQVYAPGEWKSAYLDE